VSGAYYNEIDPYAAQWLRNLIAAGHIAPGDVDERSITAIHPTDLLGYDQCHFFAGIGVWSYALRRAGWPDDREVWTGSCPCQPFSAAGKQEGFADERHLWPAWFGLIRQCRPVVVFGEQVAAKAVLPWLDLVYSDLEAAGYTVGAVDLCAAGVGAPHIRQRLFFVADSEHAERRSVDGPEQDVRDGHDAGREEAHGQLGACSEIRSVAHAMPAGRPEGRAGAGNGSPAGGSGSGVVADAISERGRGRDDQREDAAHADAPGEVGAAAEHQRRHA